MYLKKNVDLKSILESTFLIQNMSSLYYVNLAPITFPHEHTLSQNQKATLPMLRKK